MHQKLSTPVTFSLCKDENIENAATNHSFLNRISKCSYTHHYVPPNQHCLYRCTLLSDIFLLYIYTPLLARKPYWGYACEEVFFFLTSSIISIVNRKRRLQTVVPKPCKCQIRLDHSSPGVFIWK